MCLHVFIDGGAYMKGNRIQISYKIEGHFQEQNFPQNPFEAI